MLIFFPKQLLILPLRDLAYIISPLAFNQSTKISCLFFPLDSHGTAFILFLTHLRPTYSWLATNIFSFPLTDALKLLLLKSVMTLSSLSWRELRAMTGIKDTRSNKGITNENSQIHIPYGFNHEWNSTDEQRKALSECVKSELEILSPEIAQPRCLTLHLLS